MTAESAALKLLAGKTFWVLDVDDCLYPIDSGLHHFIKGNIVRVFNRVATQDPQRAAVIRRFEDILASQNVRISHPAKIQAAELGTAFIPMVRALSELYPDQLFDYLNKFYGNRYSLVKPCPDLVSAFDLARKKGVEIFFYTNGPSSPDRMIQSHLQHVMEARGFDNEVIEFVRGRTYDLLNAIHDGCGKPTQQSMNNFLSRYGIDPEKALMADDQVKNLQTARNAGLAALWTWTTDSAPPIADVETASRSGMIRVRDTGQALLTIAKGL